MKLRMLLVEDEPLIGMEVEDAVEALGHEVVGPVAELSVALDLATDETLECAILDVNIRGGQSYPVADMLLARGVPVLFLSGNSTQSFPDRLRQVMHVPKPFTGEQLEQEIRNLCNRVLDLRTSRYVGRG